MPYNLAIPGQVSEHQLKAIEAVATLVPKNGKVVEVGSLFGCSSWAWAKSVDPSATVYCIDPWEKNEGVRAMEARLGIKYGIEQFKIHTADCPNIRPLQGYSPIQFEDWSDPIDVYYEDAVHTNPILAQNLAFWSKKIKPAGILCGDDYRPRFPDVMNGAQTLAKQFGRELLRVDFFWCLLPSEELLPGTDTVAARLRALGTEHDALKRKRGTVFYIGPRNPLEPVAIGTSPAVACRVSNESLDAWPSAPNGYVSAGVRITTEAQPGKVLSETHLGLAVQRLAPDLPVDFEIALPTATLPEGKYRAVFDVVSPNGTWAMTPSVGKTSGVPFSIQPRTGAAV
ncbi:class I SAM-dependent methyltransferase [Hyphomicrobium sp.]|uniref:class I SAM-dependent methyltransferase n=1 Tax=Hyphomicrobium sp. TaxID=82 RepID=UPI0025BFED01|nr:class I SAM-dependent methyltransferase [Hyphomicrobium sp.]